MDVLAMISAILGGGDPVTVIVKLVLALGVGIGFIFLMRWINAQKAAAAHQQSDQGRAADQSNVGDQNRIISQDGQQSQNDIDQIIKNRLNPPKP